MWKNGPGKVQSTEVDVRRQNAVEEEHNGIVVNSIRRKVIQWLSEGITVLHEAMKLTTASVCWTSRQIAGSPCCVYEWTVDASCPPFFSTRPYQQLTKMYVVWATKYAKIIGWNQVSRHWWHRNAVSERWVRPHSSAGYIKACCRNHMFTIFC